MSSRIRLDETSCDDEGLPQSPAAAAGPCTGGERKHCAEGSPVSPLKSVQAIDKSHAGSPTPSIPKSMTELNRPAFTTSPYIASPLSRWRKAITPARNWDGVGSSIAKPNSRLYSSATSNLIVDPIIDFRRNPSRRPGGPQFNGRRKCPLSDLSVDRALSQPHDCRNLLEPKNPSAIPSRDGIGRHS